MTQYLKLDFKYRGIQVKKQIQQITDLLSPF